VATAGGTRSIIPRKNQPEERAGKTERNANRLRKAWAEPEKKAKKKTPSGFKLEIHLTGKLPTKAGLSVLSDNRYLKG